MTVATFQQPNPLTSAETRPAEIVQLWPERTTLRGRWLAPALILTADVLALAMAVVLSGGLAPMGLAYVAGAVLTLAVSQSYRVRLTLRALESVPWLLGRLAVPLVLLAPVALLVGVDTSLFTVVLLAMALVTGGRVASYALLRRLRRRGALLEPTVILGAGEIGRELSGIFEQHREYGIQPIGFLDRVSETEGARVLGDLGSLGRLLDRHEIRRVIVAFGPSREAEMVDVLRAAVRYDVDVHIVPRFFDCGVAPEGPDTDDVRGIPLYRVRRAALRARAWWLKRVIDVAASSLALLLTAPLFLLGAVLVKLSSPGPILFRQLRVGQDGQEFEMLKFRTLPVDHVDNRWNASDGEYSRWSRLLRRTSIDELPQLWNVLRGDMSLVGPRPERGYLVEQFNDDIDGYKDRHRLPVGVTGWAQVNGLRGETSLRERARLDNQYIEHWSIWRDIAILARTFAAVVRGSSPSRR